MASATVTVDVLPGPVLGLAIDTLDLIDDVLTLLPAHCRAAEESLREHRDALAAICLATMETVR